MTPTEKIECPLCLGEGRLTRAEVLDRLGVKDFARVAQLSAEEALSSAPIKAQAGARFRGRTGAAHRRYCATPQG
jgi:hypothetical protein